MPGNLDGSWDTYGLSDVKPKVIPVIQFEDRLVTDGYYTSDTDPFDSSQNVTSHRQRRLLIFRRINVSKRLILAALASTAVEV